MAKVKAKKMSANKKTAKKKIAKILNPKTAKKILKVNKKISAVRSAKAQPNIKFGARAKLSPFTIYLKDPNEPRTLNSAERSALNSQMENSALKEMNLLRREELDFANNDLSEIEDANNNLLSISREDLRAQIQEDDKTPPPNVIKMLNLPEFDEIDLSCEEEIADLEDIKPILASKPPNKVSWRAAITFSLLLLLIVLPMKALNSVAQAMKTEGTVKEAGINAMNSVELGMDSAINNDFAGASENFSEASQEFEKMNDLLDNGFSPLSMNKTYSTAQKLSRVGYEISETARQAAGALQNLNEGLAINLVQKLDAVETVATFALPKLKNAQINLNKVSPEIIPENYKNSYELIALGLPAINASIEEFLTISNPLKMFLGADEKKRYLVVFQNNSEIRATGGFIGSFAEVHIDDGEITFLNSPEGGSYDLQGSMQKFLAAPRPLQLINARWEFQDVNWFPDFPTSAEKMLWFYERSGGPTLDGVIAINATFISELLNTVGPLEMTEYGIAMNSENFISETQSAIKQEQAVDPSAPKKIIADMIPVLMNKIKDADAETFIKIVGATKNGLSQKDIQIFLSDEKLEQDVKNLNWGGEMKDFTGDYLSIINSNIGGGKTDLEINENVKISVEINIGGEILNHVTITRSNTAEADNSLSGVNNVNFLRLYVPRGSELVYASGFEQPPKHLFEQPDDTFEQDKDVYYSELETLVHTPSGTYVYEDGGKTVFGNWVQTKPGETETVDFIYKLPWKASKIFYEKNIFMSAWDKLGWHPSFPYAMLIQKQSGVKNRTTLIELKLPETMQEIWNNGASKINNDTDAMFSAMVETDL